MANTTVTVSIGRAVKGTPMSRGNWIKFQSAVTKLVMANASDVWVRRSQSNGEWEDSPEQSRTWVFDLDSSKLELIDDSLNAIRIDFWQDAIARTAGTTRLIGLE